MLCSNVKVDFESVLSKERFLKSFQWLKDNDIVNMNDGRYDICEGAFAIVQRYKSLPFAECKFEAHDDYFDIQFIAKGIEEINIGKRDECEVTEVIKEHDLVFLSTPKHYSSLTMRAGDYAVIAPYEAHQPRVAYNNEACDVVKVVIKVAVKD